MPYLARLGKFTSNPITILVTAGLLVALMWLVLSLEEARNRELIRHDTEKATGNLTRAFEEHVVRTFRDIDVALKLLRHEWIRNQAGFDAQARVIQDAFEHGLVVQIGFIDAGGILQYSNLEKVTTPVNLSDREHYQVHLKTTGDSLHISKPVLGRVSGRYSIQMTRAVRKDGTFRGVMVISLSPDYFARFFGSVDIGRNGSILLVGADGVVRARGSDRKVDASAFGMALPDTMPFLQSSAAPHDSYQATSLIDGRDKLFTYRHVDGFPATVLIAMDNASLYATHQARWFRYRIWAGLLTLLLLSGGGLLARAQQLQQRSRAELLQLNESLRGLSDIAAQPSSSAKKLEAVMALGCRQLAVECAVFSHLVGGQWSPHLCVAADGKELNGADTELTSILSSVLTSQVDDAAIEGSHSTGHKFATPLGEKRIAAFATVPVFVAGQIHGALSFLSVAGHRFGSTNLEFARLIGRWVSSELTEERDTLELQRLATSDALTGAKSRGYFMTAFDAERSNARRYQQSLSLLLIDLDHFKRINDHFGHPAGDATLCNVVTLCQETLRTGDIFARMGGEEFAALLPRANEADAMEVAERLRSAIAEMAVWSDGVEVKVTISIGVGQLEKDDDFDALYNRVDTALYAAKTAGRNRVVAAAHQAVLAID
ncbi:diguanylate cyclase [Pseudomonas sp. NPDC047963]|jgi:diguanylate cyclase (GGDEF)-like protein|nr:diguanylate cyclase [Pseudomonas sp.]